MNELSMLFDKLNIDFEEILKQQTLNGIFLNLNLGLLAGIVLELILII